MDSSVDDFEVVDATNDEQKEEGSSVKSEELCAGEEFRPSLQLSSSGEENQATNVTLSLKDLDLADFILDDLSRDGSDRDSEFSFVEMPKAPETEVEPAMAMMGEDFATTPASSTWSLLDCDFISDSDGELPESEESSSCLASEEDVEIHKQGEKEVPPTDTGKANKKREKKKRRKRRTKREESMIKQLFGELSKCQNEEEDKLPDFVEAGSAPSESDIPSLVVLCMRKIHLYRKRNQIKKFIKSSNFPVGMRKTVLSSNLQYSLTKSNLLWLQQNVSAFESLMTKEMNNVYSRDNDKLMFSFCILSNLWKEMDSANSVLIEACFDNGINDAYYFFDKRECYLVYATLMTFMMENTSKYVEDKGCNGKKFSRAQGVSGNSGSKQLAVVHQFLKSRYPKMTEVYFDKSVPYVYWACGKYQQSLLAFVKLYKEGSLTDKEKLFIIGEIGRMYAMKYEPEKAVRMYRLLGNCLIQARPSESEMTECQTLMLIADLQNQGVLTESKARNFLSSWKAVLRVCPTSRCSDIYLETAESLLRLHLGHLQDGNHLEMVKCILREYSKHNHKILYHLAFLNAIMGHSKSSDISYGEFFKCFQGQDADIDEEAKKSIPGMQMVDILRERKLALVHQHYDPLLLAVQNPFEPLISLGGVPVMKVIWRRQFHYSSYYTDDKGCSGFDISNPDLKLRMTKDGFITGDCSMICPPIANILLNPHTGCLTCKSDSSGFNAWKMFPFTTSKEYYCEDLCTHLPNVVEIFHHQGNDGEITAHLTGNHYFKVSRNSYYWRTFNSQLKTDQVINVHWSGPGNQRAKFSLVQKLKDYMYQKVVAEIPAHVIDGVELNREVTSLVEKWYKQGRAITSNVVYIAVSTVKEMLADIRNKKHKAKGYKPCEFKMRFISQPQRIGSSAVLLSIQVSGKYFYVIIKCQDRDSFINPVIFQAFQDDIAFTFSRSPYFCMKRPDWNTIYDIEGHVVRKTNLRLHLSCLNMTIIESNFIFFHQKRLGLLDINDGDTKYFDDFMECEFVGVQLDILILTNEYGIKFADGRKKCLKPLTILLDSSILQSGLPFKISENREQLNGNFSHVEVLAEELEETGAFAVNNCVVLFTVNTSQDREINIIKVLELPGLPMRLKFLHKSLGFLVTWTQHSKKDKEHKYREHLFQYSYTGQLLAVLPFLGQLQSSLCMEYLEEDKDITKTCQSCGHKGWYLYLQDGRQGVMCARLVQERV